MTTLTRRFATIVGAFAVLFSVVGPASAVVPAEGDRLALYDLTPDQNPSANLVTGAFFKLSQHGTTPQPGTQVNVSVYSCGQFIQSNTMILDGTRDSVPVSFSPDGGLDSGPNSVNRKIGPSFEYTIDIVQSGYDEAYRISGSYNGYGVKRPSCAEILSGDTGTDTPPADALVVKKWSKKVSLARVGTRAEVGHAVKITKTRANGNVSYKWTVGGKDIAKSRKVFIKKAHKGKSLKVKIMVVKDGKAKTKTLRYGRVR